MAIDSYMWICVCIGKVLIFICIIFIRISVCILPLRTSTHPHIRISIFYPYPGSLMTDDGKCINDIKKRVGLASAAIGQLYKIWKSKEITIKTKVMVNQVLVMPVLLYGAECWTLRKEVERRLLTMEMSCLRRMLGVARLDRMKNEEIRKRVNLPETVVEVIRMRRLTLFGHVSRMSGDRLPTRALHCYIPGRCSRGRPCEKWINNIQEDLNCLQPNMKEAMDIVRDRQEWKHRISTSSSPLG